MSFRFNFRSQAIQDVIDAHQRGEKLTPAGAFTLSGATGTDFFGVLAYADEICQSLHRGRVSFVINRNINFTNVCTLQCRFCAFSVPASNQGAYLLSLEQIVAKVQEARAAHCTEVCIQGGLHPNVGFDYYLDILRTVKEIGPELHIHAFSPQEVFYMHQRSGRPLEEVLQMLRKAGLGSIPGTAAEILVDEVRQKLCPQKITTAQWSAIIRMAHKLGIPTTSTIMFGSIETWVERCTHLQVLRSIQEETRGFTEFVPLSFINPPNGFRTSNNTPSMGGQDILKLYAIARIFFHGTIPNIQTSWVKLGPQLAQISLQCGVNDFGGTLMEENISKSAGAHYGEFLSPETIIQYIRSAGKIPYQRSTTYEKLRTF